VAKRAPCGFDLAVTFRNSFENLTEHLEEFREHGCSPFRTVSFDRQETTSFSQLIDHCCGNNIRLTFRKDHLASSPVLVQPVGDVKVLFEMVSEWKIQKRRPGRGEFHRCRQSALHEREIAGRESGIQVGHEGVKLDTWRLPELSGIEAWSGDDDHPQSRDFCARHWVGIEDALNQLATCAGTAHRDNAHGFPVTIRNVPVK